MTKRGKSPWCEGQWFQDQKGKWPKATREGETSSAASRGLAKAPQAQDPFTGATPFLGNWR